MILDGERKLREKYDKTVIDILKDRESGNQSGKSGDMDALNKLVETIQNEIEEEEENEKKAQADKANVTQAEIDVLNKKGKKNLGEHSLI